MTKSIQNAITSHIENTKQFLENESNIITIKKIAKATATAFQTENKALICGNGGSTCDAMHFAEELTGRFRNDRKALPAIPLTDPAHITCVGNDYGFDDIFSRGVEAYGKKGDIFIGISTSGNSQNIINACEKAKQLGLITIGLLGKNGGKIKGLCDHTLIVPGKTTDRIQEIHIMILHIIIEKIESILF